MSPNADDDVGVPGDGDVILDVYEMALSALPDTVFLTDEAGEFRWVCPNVDNIFGWTAETMSAEQSVTSLLGEALTPADALPRDTTEVQNVDATATDRAGDTHHLLVTIRRLDHDDERAYLYACRDVTERHERERELAESEARFRALFEGMPDPLVLLDDDARVVDVNHAACDLFGQSREELLGRPAATFTGDSFDFESTWAAFLDEGSLRDEAPIVDAAGERRTVEYTAVANSRSGEHLVSLRDVTERVDQRRELERSEARFRALFEGTLDALVIADDEGRYLDVNPAACELYGRPREELLGRTAADFAPPGFDFEAAWQEFLESDAQRGEFKLVRGDGEVRTTEFAATPNIRPGEHLSALRDATERVERERLLESQRDRLQQLSRVNDLIREVNRSLVGATGRGDVFRSLTQSIADSALYDAAAVVTLGATPAVATARGIDGQRLLDDDRLVAAVEAVYDGAESLDCTLSTPVDGVGDVSLFPLAYDGTIYGVLVVGDGPDHEFDPDERSLLAELGTTVGKAVASVASQELLHADSVIELTLDVADGELYSRIAAAVDGTVSMREVVPTDERSQIHYLRVVGDLEGLVETVEPLDGVRSCRVIRDGEEALVELVVDAHGRETAVGTLVEQGAHVVKATAGGERCRIEAAVPPDADVRGLLARVVDDHPETTLLGKRRTTRRRVGGQRGGERVDSDAVDDGSALTERQLGVLRAAAAAGYFEWPRRGTSAEELAESFGIASATLHQHLRVAMQKVVEGYLDTVADGRSRS